MANNTKILKFNSGTEYDFRPFVNCTTAANNAVKSITLNDFTLFTGATIIVKFINGNIANTMTLSINSSVPIEVDYPVTDIGTYEFVYDGNKWLNLTSGPNSDIKYFEYKFTIDGNVSYLKIADLSDWNTSNYSNHYLIGNIYGNRGETVENASNANLHGTGIYNITAVVSSYKSEERYYTHKLYINNTANLFETNNDGKAIVIEPCIIEHNNKKWLALKKIGSSCYIRFTGLIHNILPQDQWAEIGSNSGCTEYATANYTDGYAITTEKYYDGNQINTLLHSNNYSNYTKELENKINETENKIDALAAGLTLSLSVTAQNPNDTTKYISVAHKNSSIEMKVTASVKNNLGNVNANITIKNGVEPFETIGKNFVEGNPPTINTLTVNPTLSTTNSSHTYIATADVNGLILTKSASIAVRYPVYYGMLKQDTTIFNESTLSTLTKATPITTIVSNTFNAIANENGMRFYLLVPSDVTGSNSFTMGGTPVSMAKFDAQQTINNIKYTIYYTNAFYNKNAEVQIKAN